MNDPFLVNKHAINEQSKLELIKLNFCFNILKTKNSDMYCKCKFIFTK